MHEVLALETNLGAVAFAVLLMRRGAIVSLMSVDVLVLASVSLIEVWIRNPASWTLPEDAALVYLTVRLTWSYLADRSAKPQRQLVGERIPILVLGALLTIVLAIRYVAVATMSIPSDVGFAGYAGAHELMDGRWIYGMDPASLVQPPAGMPIHGPLDTYGPVAYMVVVPVVATLILLNVGASSMAVASMLTASVAFDIACLGLLALAGWRRSPTAGVLLALAWAAFPLTTYVMLIGSNDALVGGLLLGCILAFRRHTVRGLIFAVAVMAKLIPAAAVGALVGGPTPPAGSTVRRFVAGALMVTAAIAGALYALGSSPATMLQRSVLAQAARPPTFRTWFELPIPHARTLVAAAVLFLLLTVWTVRRPASLPHAACGIAACMAIAQIALPVWYSRYLLWMLGPFLVWHALAPWIVRGGPERSIPEHVAPITNC